MSLEQDLGLPNPVVHNGHAAILGIVLTAAMLSKEGDRVLRPCGVTDSQFNVLMLLKYQTIDGQINQTKLGRMLLVNRSNVTGLIDRMEQAGWVKRQANPEDRRVKMVILTDSGSKVAEKAEKLYFERLDWLLGELSESSMQQLGRALERLRQRIRKG